MHLEKVRIQRYRALSDATLAIHSVNVFFGPNSAGKTSFLDALWFLRDCAIRGTEEAAADRDHGIGLLWDDEGRADSIEITLETSNAQYATRFALASGRIDPYPGEILTSKNQERTLIHRLPGQTKATFHHQELDQNIEIELREPTKMALTRYLDLEKNTAPDAAEIDGLLRFLRYHDSRNLDFWGLRRRGSETSHQTRLWDRASNMWSVLRNLHDRRTLDDRFDTILEFLREAFPKLKDLFLEQTAPNVVIGNFIEEKRTHPIQASGVSDGYLQLLIHLTALFSEGRDRPAILLIDEPESSLHPHAIVVLARAIKIATESWHRQVLLATHSPVLLSQFSSENIVLVTPGPRGEANLQRISDMKEIQDLLEEYALGSLYMAEAIGSQGSP